MPQGSYTPTTAFTVRRSPHIFKNMPLSNYGYTTTKRLDSTQTLSKGVLHLRTDLFWTILDIAVRFALDSRLRAS